MYDAHRINREETLELEKKKLSKATKNAHTHKMKGLQLKAKNMQNI